MGEITLTTFLLQEVQWELRALLVVLVPLAGFGVLVGEIKGFWLGFGSLPGANKKYHLLIFHTTELPSFSFVNVNPSFIVFVFQLLIVELLKPSILDTCSVVSR